MAPVKEIPARSRSQPWFSDETLASIPRRDDMFVDPIYAQAVFNTAIAMQRTVSLAWLSLQYDEDRDKDLPVQREHTGFAVMEIVDYYPMGWVYLIHPDIETALVVSLDVITDIAIDV